MSAFFTWANLATIAGATAATAYIVQFLKKFSIFSKANSQAVSYGVALIILFLATYFTGNLTASTGVMIFFNAVIVAFSSNGAYDSVKSTITAIAAAAGGGTSAGAEATTPDNSSESNPVDPTPAEGATSGAADAATVKNDTALSSQTATEAQPSACESGAIASDTTGAQ